MKQKTRQQFTANKNPDFEIELEKYIRAQENQAAKNVDLNIDSFNKMPSFKRSKEINKLFV